MLALRPSDEKKPAEDLAELGETGDFKEDAEEREVLVDTRDLAAEGWANEGYGSGGGPRGGLVSTRVRTERSVAVVVSARLGNVASDAMDDRDTCLGWKPFWAVDGPRGPRGHQSCALPRVSPCIVIGQQRYQERRITCLLTSMLGIR